MTLGSGGLGAAGTLPVLAGSCVFPTAAPFPAAAVTGLGCPRTCVVAGGGLSADAQMTYYSRPTTPARAGARACRRMA